LYGSNQTFEVKKEYLGITSTYTLSFEGVVKYIENYSGENSSQISKKWADAFMNKNTCDVCGGARLKKESLNFLIGGRNIADLSNMDLTSLYSWVDTAEEDMDDRQKQLPMKYF